MAFGLRCKEMGIRPSMGSVGDTYDNDVREHLATLECEILGQQRFRTQAEAKMAVFSVHPSTEPGQFPRRGAGNEVTSGPGRGPSP